MSDVLLISMPFAPPKHPAAGLSILKSILTKNNISCEIMYANLLFKELISTNLYEKISSSYVHFLLGEYLFSHIAFPYNTNGRETYMQKFKQFNFETTKINETVSLHDISKLTKTAKQYITDISKSILDKKPKIVGFQNTFSQTCASISLANLLKEKNQNIITVMGGWNCQQPMASELAKMTKSIDYFFSGESDIEFLDFCQNKLIHSKLPSDRIINCNSVENLDLLPYPDFTDFFRQSNKTQYYQHKVLNNENSRGCWWGEKSHCIFCGSNGLNMKYRSKSSQRIKEEALFLSKKYKANTIYPTDNIIPIKDFPNFSHIKKKYINFFYTVRPTLKFDDLYRLRKNHFKIFQPGIESLSDSLLKIMKKGTSAINNIRFLRDCESIGIKSSWCFLYDIPGETEKDYMQMLSFLPKISHLRPPVRISSLSIQRYSYIFDNYKSFNIKNLRPREFYSYVYPGDIDFDKFAAYFEGEFPKAFDNFILKEKFFSALSHWDITYKSQHPILAMISLDNLNTIVIDTRPISLSKFTYLDPEQTSIIKFLDTPKNRESFIKHIITMNITMQKIKLLFHNRYILKINNRYISLITYAVKNIANKSSLKKYDLTNNYMRFVSDLQSDDELFYKFKYDPTSIINYYKLESSIENIYDIRKQLNFVI